MHAYSPIFIEYFSAIPYQKFGKAYHCVQDERDSCKARTRIILLISMAVECVGVW